MKTAGQKKTGKGWAYELRRDELWEHELSDRLYRLQHFSRSSARPGPVQPDRVCAAAFRGGDSGGTNFHRHRAPGGVEPGADGGVTFFGCVAHLFRVAPRSTTELQLN